MGRPFYVFLKFGGGIAAIVGFCFFFPYLLPGARWQPGVRALAFTSLVVSVVGVVGLIVGVFKLRRLPPESAEASPEAYQTKMFLQGIGFALFAGLFGAILALVVVEGFAKKELGLGGFWIAFGLTAAGSFLYTFINMSEKRWMEVTIPRVFADPDVFYASIVSALARLGYRPHSKMSGTEVFRFAGSETVPVKEVIRGLGEVRVTLVDDHATFHGPAKVVLAVRDSVPHQVLDRPGERRISTGQRTEAAGPEASYLHELEKLAELRDKGIVTSEEFEAKKKQLLGL